ncbi:MULTISPECIES: autoinducer-binding transcriptional regulator TraR [unclassified Shinella]|uniref:autoinducer-binding transcriptional regulator TraR n=1 Tax=unclassified Shinella TaxID=2643062 RepID=UPI00234E6E78|nr:MULTISPECIES: transcriptional regulator TraR [unclassified Shinella]MCO5154010.1 transcriptional regulator TraR [Shinella sp.]MDC7266929.1 transcriptional regulator TraR [Shinella sp. HY16]MDC7273826.1 transcriptional regulator TraR [Shinella sp. YZ44]
MRHWLDKLTDLAAIPGDESILKDALATFSEQIGFAGYAYLNIQPGRPLAISNYRQEWQSDYFERGYLAIDPVIRRAKSLKRAFTWSGKQDNPRLTKTERSFFAHAADFGIRSGITVPIKAAYGSIAMFTLASEKPAINLDREIDPVEAASAVAQLHARINLADPTPSVEEPIGLDPKGTAYLSWIAVGKTMEEVADLEGVKYNSVRVKLAETKKRFDVHTTTHLTALAIRRKLI